MRISLSLCMTGAAALPLLVQPARGQVLFSEGFDSAASASVTEIQDPDTYITYVDYSNFTVGSTAQSIEEAPNQVPGSAPTRGVLMQANLNGGSLPTYIVHLIAADAPDGTALDFSGDYRVTFDMFLSVADPIPSGGTEVANFGIGHDGATLQGYRTRGSAVSGTWGWLATEGGIGASGDIGIYEAGVAHLAQNDASEPAFFAAAFPNGAPAENAPNGHWVEVEITVIGGQVSFKFNGVEAVSVTSALTDGAAYIGYEDAFNGSVSGSPDFQWGLFDNFVVETAVEATFAVTQDAPFPTVTEPGPVTATFTLENRNAFELTVSEVNIDGENAGDFVVVSDVPLAIPANNSESLVVAFDPAAPNGSKQATMTLVSDDPQQPNLTVPLGGRRAVAPPLVAHYRLDETSGTTLIDSSGNGADGAFIARDPIGFGEPPLIPDGGTSIHFIDAAAADAGNFAFAPRTAVPNTPTVSLSAWVRPEDDGTGDDTILNRDPFYNGADDIYGLFLNPDGSAAFRAGGEFTVTSPAGSVPDGEVSHIVVTHLDTDGFGNDTAERTRMYIDGNLVAEVTGAETSGWDEYPANSSTTSLHIATRTAAGYGFTGEIDDIQIYSVELTENQVAGIFAQPGSTADFSPPAPFVITDIEYDGFTEQVTLTWNSSFGKIYSVHASQDADVFFEVADSLPSGGLSTTYQFANPFAAAGAQNAFFLVQESN